MDILYTTTMHTGRNSTLPRTSTLFQYGAVVHNALGAFGNATLSNASTRYSTYLISYRYSYTSYMMRCACYSMTMYARYSLVGFHSV